MDSFNNFTNSWQHAASATWDDPSLCVKDSKIFASRKATDSSGPTSDQKNALEAGRLLPFPPQAINQVIPLPGLYAQGLNTTSPSNFTDLNDSPIDSGVAYDDIIPIDRSQNTHCRQPGKHCRTKSECVTKPGSAIKESSTTTLGASRPANQVPNAAAPQDACIVISKRQSANIHEKLA